MKERQQYGFMILELGLILSTFLIVASDLGTLGDNDTHYYLPPLFGTPVSYHFTLFVFALICILVELTFIFIKTNRIELKKMTKLFAALFLVTVLTAAITRQTTVRVITDSVVIQQLISLSVIITLFLFIRKK